MEVFLFFIFYSFFGCVLENVYYYVCHKEYVSKRTLISLPLCPVYGVAAIVLLAVNSRTQNIFILFLNGFFAVSAVELVFYLVSLRLYGVKWWDYSEHRINIMGGVSLYYSVIWGLLNILLMWVIHPAVSVWIFSLPSLLRLYMGLFLAVYFMADSKETHRELLKLKNGEESVVFDKFLYIKTNN